jgi:hypothetical protein
MFGKILIEIAYYFSIRLY